jgi:hypothetical protein
MKTDGDGRVGSNLKGGNIILRNIKECSVREILSPVGASRLRALKWTKAK